MKIRIEIDHNILKEGNPQIRVIEIEDEVTDLGELLMLFEDCALALGYRFGGKLVVEEEDETSSV
jgi:hypothetical protein